jgi:hypothetical protein
MFRQVFSRNSSNCRINHKSHGFRFESLEDRRLMTATPADIKAGTDWLNANVQTAAIRQVAIFDFQDGVLGRNDMINILTAAENAGKLTATEFSDLQAIVKHDAFFTTDAYVQILSKDIVLGNVANAHFQGTTLGNMAVGSTGLQQGELIDKWFLGEDVPAIPVGSYALASGSLYHSDGSVSFEDVVQGIGSDCYLMSSLSEVAQRAPQDIKNMIIDNGDGTWTVGFFNGSTRDYVTVNRMLPVDSSGKFEYANIGASAGSSSNVLWVALVEKAYSQIDEAGWLSKLDVNSDGTSARNNANEYEHYAWRQDGPTAFTEFGTGGIDDGRAYIALQEITGSKGNWMNPTNPNWSIPVSINMLNMMNLVLAHMTVVDTPSNEPSSALVPSHSYSVYTAYPIYSAGGQLLDVEFVLRNPWGAPGAKPEYVAVDYYQFISWFDQVNYV